MLLAVSGLVRQRRLRRSRRTPTMYGRRRLPASNATTHLAAHLGQDRKALLVVGVRRAQRRPGAHGIVPVRAEEREAHLDPAELIRVDEIGDDGRVDAEVARAPIRRRARAAPSRHLVHGGALGLEPGAQPAHQIDGVPDPGHVVAVPLERRPDAAAG